MIVHSYDGRSARGARRSGTAGQVNAATVVAGCAGDGRTGATWAASDVDVVVVVGASVVVVVDDVDDDVVDVGRPARSDDSPLSAHAAARNDVHTSPTTTARRNGRNICSPACMA